MAKSKSHDSLEYQGFVTGRQSINEAFDVFSYVLETTLDDEFDLLTEYILEYPQGMHAHRILHKTGFFPADTLFSVYWRMDSRFRKVLSMECYAGSLLELENSTVLAFPFRKQDKISDILTDIARLLRLTPGVQKIPFPEDLKIPQEELKEVWKTTTPKQLHQSRSGSLILGTVRLDNGQYFQLKTFYRTSRRRAKW